MRWFRRKKRDAPAPPVPAAEPLGPDLYAYLLDELRHAPLEIRRHGQWVMNTEWLNEVRTMDDRPSSFLMRPMFRPVPLGRPVTLLGLPIKVRDDGGMPHLEPAPLEPAEAVNMAAECEPCEANWPIRCVDHVIEVW